MKALYATAATVLAAAVSLLSVSAGIAGAAGQADLAQVQTIYLLPMTSGLDQYLANKLTERGVFQVVTEPARADAVFSDQIGAGLERRLDEMFPPQQTPEQKAEAEKAAREEEKGLDAKELAKLRKERADEAEAQRIKRREMAGPQSTFSRGRGNVFLVDVKTRRVIWSIFERPKQFTPDALTRSAGRIVAQLQKDRSGKP